MSQDLSHVYHLLLDLRYYIILCNMCLCSNIITYISNVDYDRQRLSFSFFSLVILLFFKFLLLRVKLVVKIFFLLRPIYLYYFILLML